MSNYIVRSGEEHNTHTHPPKYRLYEIIHVDRKIMKKSRYQISSLGTCTHKYMLRKVWRGTFHNDNWIALWQGKGISKFGIVDLFVMF